MVHMVSNVCYTGYDIKSIWYVKDSIWYNKQSYGRNYISTISPQNVPYLKTKFDIQIKNLPYHKMK